MAAVQLRELSTAADVMANARAVAARIAASRAIRKPPQKPVERPAIVTLPQSPAPVEIAPAPPPESKPTVLSKPAVVRASEPLSQFVVPAVVEIMLAVCRRYRATRVDLMSKRRTSDVVRPRQVAMYLAKKLTSRTLPDIGRRFGGRDHTTVLHAVRKITSLRLIDAGLDQILTALEFELNPPPVTADPNQLALPLAGEAG